MSGEGKSLSLRPEELLLTLVDGPGGTVTVRGHEVAVSGQAPVRVPLDGQGPRLPTITGYVPLIHGRPARPDEVTIGLPSE